MTTFSQSDPRWGKLLIAPRYPLGKYGCLVTCIAEASRRSGGLFTPADVLANGKAAGGFYGPNAVLSKLAETADLYAPRTKRVFSSAGIEALKKSLLEAVEAGGFAILHVNHDEDAAADHFVLAFEVRPEAQNGRADVLVEFADPATGKEGQLSFSNLEGDAGWGGKRYSVLSVAPIFPAEAAPT